MGDVFSGELDPTAHRAAGKAPPWARRRNVIDRGESQIVGAVSAAVALVLGIQSVAADVSPTDAAGTDFVVVACFAALVAWAGASAPWWAITSLGGVGALATGVSIWTVPAMLCVVIGLALGATKRSLPWARTAATGCALLGLMRVSVNPFFGGSALLVGLTATVFVFVGLRRRHRVIRRRVVWGLAGAIAVVVLATVGLGVGGLQARDDLEAGRTHLTDGLDQLRAGETVEAAASLRAAATDLQRASDSVGAAWTQPSRMIPVVAHHRSLLVGIVDNAAASALAAADALDVADIDQLQVVNGSIDVDALALLAGPLGDLDVAVENMTTVLRDSNSSWLIGAIQDELAKGLDEIEGAAAQSRATAAAAANGPAMLGIDESRRYLVVFTSPGEARGQSGLMGNWAEITITDGRIRQTDFGRTSELIADITESGRTDLDPSDLVLDASDEYFARYGAFGAGSTDEGVLPKYWSNVTMSPDSPTVASVMSQMYEAGGHQRVDGVFVVDATGLATLLRVAGPVTVDGLDQEITADTLEQFLLFDQYQLEESDRRDLLEAVAGVTLQQFLTASLPEPQQLAATMGPAATEGHIVGWARRPEEQEVFRLIGMAGRLPEPDGRDGIAIVTDNASGNKIDSFLERTVSYVASYDEGTGRVDGELVVTLHNTAPSSGYPDYVIGNLVGLPTGTNRTLLTVYSPLGVEAVTVDDRPGSVTAGTELGWNTATLLVDIAPGDTVTLRYELAGQVSGDRYEFVWRSQPLAIPDAVSVDVRSTDGDREAFFVGELPRLTVIDGAGQNALR